MSDEMDDYSGPFRPDFRLEDFSKEALVTLCREFMMVAHLLDRSIMPAILQRFGAQAMEELAIEEWRGASPVYTQRIRKAMKVEGNDVASIFKSLQIDPGFPHQYMDVKYEVVDEKKGYFWLELLRRARGRRAVGRGARRLDVPPHRGPDLRRDHAGGEPEGEVPPGAPPAARSQGPQAGLPLGSHDRRRRRSRPRRRRSRRSRGSRRLRPSSSDPCESAAAREGRRERRQAREGPRVVRQGDGLPAARDPERPVPRHAPSTISSRTSGRGRACRPRSPPRHARRS